MTAGEIARDLGSSYLYEILAPGIRNGVPCSTLHKLQLAFHTIIHTDLAYFEDTKHLRLPDLTPLTELDVPEMWFPLKMPDASNPRWLRVSVLVTS
jgi:hypothetical protein